MVKRLLTLNGMAIIASVIHHSTDWALTAMIWWADRYQQIEVPALNKVGGLEFFILRGIDQFAFFAVPGFLFISGFFISAATKKNEKTISKNIILQRVKFLIYPYLIWSTIILFLNLLLGETYTLLKISKAMITGGVVGAYYFVPLLIVFYVLSPVFVPLAKDRWKVLIFGAVILAGLATFLRYENLLGLNIPGPDWLYSKIRNSQFCANCIWFVFGIVVGFHKTQFSKSLARNRKLILVLLILSYIFGIVEWNIIRVSTGRIWIAPQVTLIDQFFAFLFILFWLAYDKVNFKFDGFIIYASKKSYGIYLLHVPVLLLASKFIYHLAPQLLAWTFFFQFIIILAGLGLPLLMMKMVEISPARAYYKYIFG